MPNEIVADVRSDAALPASLRIKTSAGFVPRRTQWNDLRTAWDALRDDQPRTVLVGGCAGSGKTRLVSEFARFAHDHGAVVLYGACAEQPDVPFVPFTDCVRHAIGVLGDLNTLKLRTPLVADLGLLLPELSAVHAPERAEAVVPPDAQRHWLFEAVASLLGLLAKDRAVVVVLDDLHWIQPPAAELFDYVIRVSGIERLLVVGTFRTPDGNDNDAFAELFDRLMRQPSVTRTTLSNFDRSEIAAFLEVLSGERLPVGSDAIVDYFASATDGNAFLVQELWHHLLESNRLARYDGRWTLRSPVPPESPATIRRIVGRRLANLPATTSDLVRWAAVTGGTFELSLTGAVTGRTATQVMDLLQPAVAIRLVSDLGGDRFAFVHDLTRKAIEETLTAADRRQRHLQVARAIASRTPPARERLAFHLIAAVPLASPAEAIACAREAAAEAVRSVAFDRAEGVLLAALAIADDQATRVDLLCDLAMAYSLGAGVHKSIQAARDALMVAQALGDDARLVRAAALLAEATWRGAIDGEATAEVLAGTLERNHDEPTRARLLAALATALALSGRDNEARDAADQAARIARHIGDDRLLFESLIAGLYSWTPHTIASHRTGSEELVVVAQGLTDESLELRAVSKVLIGAFMVSDTRRLHDGLARHEQLARRLRQPFFLRVTRGWHFVLDLSEGRFAEAERRAIENSQTSFHVEDPAPGYSIQMYSLRREQGRLCEIRPLLEMLLKLNAAPPMWKPGLANIYAELGMIDEAEAVLDDLGPQGLESIPHDTLWPAVVSYLADASAATGHVASAKNLYAMLRPYAGMAICVPGLVSYGAADRYLGRLAETCRRFGAAGTHYEAGWELDSQAGWTTWTAHSQFAFGRFLLDRGRPADRRRGEALVTEAFRTARQLGMSSLTAKCEQVLCSGSERAAEQRLTPREVMVLRLVAKGRTNRQIGDELHTSPHTVANQVGVVLAKTGCANRTEAAAWAHAHGLAASP
jgi:DNA-binding CsgD family transcriptional regulator